MTDQKNILLFLDFFKHESNYVLGLSETILSLEDWVEKHLLQFRLCYSRHSGVMTIFNFSMFTI